MGIILCFLKQLVLPQIGQHKWVLNEAVLLLRMLGSGGTTGPQQKSGGWCS